MSSTERAELLSVLHHERFVDLAPASVYAQLFDEGRYLCSVPTMYRLLRAEGEVRERRRHTTRPAAVKPELMAAGANQVWSWDITKLLGPRQMDLFPPVRHHRHLFDIYCWRTAKALSSPSVCSARRSESTTSSPTS